jgi:Mannosylglycerate hydrolase MGH1-like glycoside hydrolase domain
MFARTFQRWLVVAAAIGLAVAGYFVWRAPPASGPQHAAAGTPPASRPGIFARWLQFEPEAVRNNPAAADTYVDAVLGHQVFRIPPRGVHPQIARQLLLDDDKLLLSSGRRLWTRELAHQPGLAGEFCYGHSTYCLRRLFDVSFSVDGQPVVIYDNQYWLERYPSHTIVHYQLPHVSIDERKFITYDDRAVATYAVSSNDEQPHTVGLEVTANYPPVPGSGDAPPSYPLLGSGTFQGMPLSIYLDAPDFTRLDSSLIHLRRDIAVPASGTAPDASVAVRFDTVARATPETPIGQDAHREQARTYNRWFADNVPYFDAADPAFKKMWYYRWWIVRFHLVEMDTPDLKGFAFYEGKLGFDNPIGFAVPAQLKELSYLRDPQYGISQVENSYRNRAANGAVVDPPGSPYWGETYSHWIAMALAEFNRVHPLPADTLRELLPLMAADVRAWLSAYDADGDGLPERDRPRVTGYDLDILSYWYFDGTRLDARAEPPALERVDFASFVFANAAAVAELATVAGDTALANEFTAVARRVQDAALSSLWDDDSAFFYPQRAEDNARVPLRELHGFFPFTTLLAPDEPRYTAALAALVDTDEFWARYPPVIISQRHYRDWTWEMDGLTRNIAPHPISMGARTLLQALKHYHQGAVQPEHFMELMSRYNDLVYPGVYPSDPLWRPNVHEYYSKWEPYSQSIRPKPSDISHDFHSMYLSLIVEGVVGLTPRSDSRIELQPMARRWSYFLLDGLRYHGHDLTIVWDRPDGQVRYTGYPEGFSLYIDGALAFTRPDLGHVVYDPATQNVEPL